MIRKLTTLALLLVFSQIVLADNNQPMEFGADKKSEDLLTEAKGGDALAQYRLGFGYRYGYENGYSFTRDCKQAVYWFTKAAEQAETLAQYELAEMYKQGQCVTQNYKQAFGWYTKAAEHGSIDAQEQLAIMYEEGLGVIQSNENSYVWFSIAAAKEHSLGTIYDAINQRDSIATKLTPKALEEAQAEAAELMKKIEQNQSAKK